MVRVEENKLIIEIKLGEKGKAPDYTPAQKLEEIRSAILEAIKCFDYENMGKPFMHYALLNLLEELQPTNEQIDRILKAN